MLVLLVSLNRVERLTVRLEIASSIQLSYKDKKDKSADSRNWTRNLRITGALLYRLSYVGIW